MSRVLYRPQVEHSCNIGWTDLTVTQEEADKRNAENGGQVPASTAGTFVVTDQKLRALPGGSVVECDECGRVWVKNPVGWQHDARSAFMVDNSWRPEKRRERRRRLRATS